jgi:hypothetical protein
VESAWPAKLPAVSVRFARPTLRLAECAEFYGEVLGLPVVPENPYWARRDAFTFTDPDGRIVIFASG